MNLTAALISTPIRIILFDVLIPLAALFLLRKAIRVLLAEVGRRALAKQPLQIRLARQTSHGWANASAVQAFVHPLSALGFSDAGIYAINELPGVYVWIFVKESDAAGACVYEHPKSGVWMDLYCRYRDGGGLTFTTTRDRGLEHRPGSQVIHVPGGSVETLYRRLLAERRAPDLTDMRPDNIVSRFEDSWARAQAWRQNKGISAEEVARHIQTRPQS